MIGRSLCYRKKISLSLPGWGFIDGDTGCKDIFLCFPQLFGSDSLRKAWLIDCIGLHTGD